MEVHWILERADKGSSRGRKKLHVRLNTTAVRQDRAGITICIFKKAGRIRRLGRQVGVGGAEDTCAFEDRCKQAEAAG